MRDFDVRLAVKAALAKKYAGDVRTRIVDEMGIWAGSARIDIAVINGELTGYELKSDRDTLQRLDKQAELYNQVFDRVILVAATRHVDRILERVPAWWGVTVAESAGQHGSVHLRETRPPELNPAIDALQVARLLWRSEALTVLAKHGLDKGFRTKRAELLAMRLAACLPMRTLCGEVRQTLKSRQGWLGEPVGN
ncbi:MAG: sce7726 family protein [Cucumibacter sp.]